MNDTITLFYAQDLHDAVVNGDVVWAVTIGFASLSLQEGVEKAAKN